MLFFLSLITLFSTSMPLNTDELLYFPNSEEMQIVSNIENDIENALNIQDKINENEKKMKEQEELKLKEEKEINQKKEAIEKKETKVFLGTFKATAYDLSMESCGKGINDKNYGLTASGYNLSNKTLEEARTIAVDTRLIKMGTKVYLEFPENDFRSQYNGYYTARDTGGAIKGHKIDLFMGDFRKTKTSEKVTEFGVSQVKIFIIK